MGRLNITGDKIYLETCCVLSNENLIVQHAYHTLAADLLKAYKVCSKLLTLSAVQTNENLLV